jgi:hypothetical protein
MTTGWLIFSLVGSYLVICILTVWGTVRMPVVPMRRIARDEAPEPVEEAIADAEATRAAGLALVAIHQSASPETSPHGQPALSGHVLHFAGSRPAVHALHYITPKGQWRAHVTEFADGSEVVTGTVIAGDMFDYDSRIHLLRVPGTYDLARQHALHLAHVEHVKGPGAPTVMREGDALLGMVPERERGLMERQRAMGALAGGPDVYRPTLWSAVMWTLRLLPPLAQIRKLRHVRLRRTLEAGIDRPRAG